MNSRPTPETDEKASFRVDSPSCIIVLAEFARKLERERDEAREEVDYYREKHDLTPMSWNV